MMKYLVLVCTLFIGLPSFAQYVVRNGGYSVQCLNSPIKALEIAEGEAQGAQIHYSTKRFYLTKASDLIGRIAAVDMEKARKYLKWLGEWKSQIKWMAQLDQYSPHDQGKIKLPYTDCRLRVGIVQINETRFGVQQYWINPAVWNTMDEDQKAALVLHELIYRDLLEENPNSNSSFVRQVNLKVHTLDLNNDRKAFIDLLRAL
ncbi:hypothetical protein [uncultured Bdellovibrio sp.]|uniref:hypothetical protein n=1 Tax=Bdellovibrio sp. HCB-162 TaxID=3394234 RepID=UPI0025CD7C73|nr:hypothetical protein [uncultured Bdellovibrio sp.]